MQPGGTITGVVTDNTGHKLSNVCVRAGEPDAGTNGPVLLRREFRVHEERGVHGQEPGSWTIRRGLRLWFRLPQTRRAMVHGTAGRRQRRPRVSRPRRKIASHINATLPLGGTVTGTVRDQAGKPLPGICVLAIPAGSQYPTLAYLFGPGMSVTGGNGSYRVGDLAPGTYDLQFKACGRPIYGSQWYRGRATEQASTPVTVRSGVKTSGINAVMADRRVDLRPCRQPPAPAACQASASPRRTSRLSPPVPPRRDGPAVT